MKFARTMQSNLKLLPPLPARLNVPLSLKKNVPAAAGARTNARYQVAVQLKFTLLVKSASPKDPISRNRKREVTDNEETSYDADALGSGGETGTRQPQQEGPSPDQQEKTGQGEKEQVPGGFITEEKEEEALPGDFTLD